MRGSEYDTRFGCPNPPLQVKQDAPVDDGLGRGRSSSWTVQLQLHKLNSQISNSLKYYGKTNRERRLYKISADFGYFL